MLDERGPRSRRIQAPHPPLEAYYDGEAGRRSFVQRIFDETAKDYDRIERLMALGTGPWYRREALRRAGLGPGMRVLDVAVGTGLVAREAATLVGDPSLVTGLDPSLGMLRAASRPCELGAVQGVAERLPFASARFDFVSMGFALRHMTDLSVVFGELRRVLKPRGRACLLEITRPDGALARALVKSYLRGLVPALARGLTRHRRTAQLMRYHWDTIEACVPPARVMAALREAGFGAVSRHVELGIFSEYTAERP